ncbi:hypothetical protein PRNP1_006160 [Phytophthora ramorum]
MEDVPRLRDEDQAAANERSDCKSTYRRRGRQWSEVFERYGYRHPSLTAANSSSDADTTKQKLSPPQWLETLISDLLLLNEQVAATAHCAVNRSPVAANRGSVAAQALPVLVKQHAVSLETHHRLQHAKQLSPAAVDGLVHVEDVNFLMQFKYMQNQQAVVLERFCVRLKWLPVSHRFHLRQRMLALVHQQKVKNTPRPSATTVYQNSKDHLHCPLFIMTASHFAAELKSLAQKYSLPIPDMADSKTSAGEYVPLKQHAEALLASAVGAFPPDDAINTEGRLELGVETLVHAYTRNSRWELIQRGYLGSCEPNQEQSEDSLVALRNSHKIDSLLANEWELLGLDDVGYLRVRLEALSRAHMDRAKVDVAKPEPAVVGDSMLLGGRVQSMQALGDTADDDESGDLPFTKRKADAPHTWNSGAIYVLYLLRMSSCRAKRLSLLRLLNYLHFIQLSQSPVHNTTASSRPVPAAAPTPWTVTKCEKTGDYIVKRHESSEKKEDVDDEDCDDSSRDHEFFFAAARRDLEVLELQMLRIASIFLFKQEYESLPTSSRKHSDDQYYRSGHDSDTAVATIDRLQVLRDIYDCEVAFQQAKVQLVEQLLASGLRYAPRHQDFSELGFSTAPQAQTEPFAEILFPLLQRRPLIDFSHAYFFESYAAETILLELQASLIQQMEQYFQRLEWCAHQEFAVGDRDRVEDEQGQWVCRQVLGTNALTRLYSQQRELVRKADETWFTATSIGEFHALQHALLEQTLVAWALIIKLELPGRPVRCLERTAGDLLGGSGWQLVLPPQLLADVCRTLHNESTTATKAERPQGSSSRSLIEWLAGALELENWRRELARSVYEAHLLERVHHFQFGFVKQASAFDTVIGGEQARHLTFYFDFGECDRAKALHPVAVELQSPMFHATNATPASKHAALRSDDSQSVSEWLQAQLRGLQSRSADLDEKSQSDDAATPADHSQSWRRSLLVLQQQYAAHLEVIVSYQDAVGADVFDFAASYPYVCLANSFAPESSSSSDQNSTLAMDISTVRSKYAKEIADKMAEEMRTSCFPYWKRLENLKQQLQERFATAPNRSSGLRGLNLEVDMASCGAFLSEESYHAMLLTTLNDNLQCLRNEKRLMQQLSPATRVKCAFISHSAATSASDRDTTARKESGDEDQPSGLMKWLMVKLHQLKVDLHVHERPKVEQLLLTPPASCTSPSAPSHCAKRTFGASRSPAALESSPDAQSLLETIPSFRYLLYTFATTGNHERSQRDSTGGAASAHATRLHGHREETLRALLSIFHQFRCTVDLLRIQCSSRFSSTKKTSVGGGQRKFPTAMDPHSSLGDPHSGLSRLERWQGQFHREIRQLLDHIAGRFSPEAVVVIGDLFDTHPEQLQSQHYASLMRRELCKALQDTNAHLVRVLRCTTTFALLQTYQKNAGLRIRRRRQLLVTFQSSLEFVAAEATASPHHLRKQQPAEYRLSNREEQMRRLVLVAEQALFAEARPRDREREWLAFIDAVGRYEPRDSAYIAALIHLLDLHRVFIDENCQAFLRLDDEPTSSSTAIQYLAEKQALTALEDLWERFHLPAWDSLLGDQVSSSSGRSAAVVGGENLHMKKRLLGNGDLGIGTSSPSDASPFSSPKDLSYALRSLQMGATTALAQFCTSGLLVLPPPGNVDDQLVYLQISIELTWVNADMKELEDQYSKFLFHRKRRREYQRSPNVAAQKSPKRPGTSCTMSSSLLLGLNKYFHQEGIPVDNAARPDPSMTRADVESKKQEAAPAFVVPATEMARFLHDVIAQCVTHNNQQLDLHATFMRQLHDECQTAALDREKIEKQWAKAKLEERIRREAFAVDHAFHLYFEVEALRKQLSVMEARKELDQQDLRCELNAEYDEKLHKMHVELLNKQQKFAEYRTTMQRELQTVIQESHSQFVDQLLDYSGALPSATKTSVSTLLRGQQDIVRTKSENAAMKQALLKVKALGDMQQQTQNAARDRELLLTRRYATAEALQRNEVEHLQTYVKQLEGNLSRLSQEKTYFQVKWTTAQKQMEATAQRRHEAKIRALSASHTRTSTAPGAKSPDDDGFAANFTRCPPTNGSKYSGCSRKAGASAAGSKIPQLDPALPE